MKTLALLHTTPVTVASMKALASERAPNVRVVNILDDSLLPEVMAAGRPTEGVRARMRAYAENAVAAGADAVMCCCSSVGDVVDDLRDDLSVPFLRIDAPMAVRAVALGSNVGVIATVRSTLEPTANLVERAAREAGRDATVERVLVEGAYDALVAGHAERHDELVKAALSNLAARSDVVVLAQASMARLLPSLHDLTTPVLSSPESGLAKALEALS
ncbi:aspartate/glutamate racemase family protein [Deinococcus yavapaiensis]|uniref:Aspartate/glutamate racemase n=1 Tax=Deinococcus yavapaiensis KR-236 TaxID=694435 RepID=A0A318S825_9DEIO|nr:aspartate/glutamate racemase family protein [Deinococcus yavapaiensis]PYE54602.1 aspartate/glutamate racemase [Deinococcus yavapaiensis KR-236]